MNILLAVAIAAFAPSQIVASLNHQRVANGIPGGITLNAAWTTGCTHHIRYDELNGITWTHIEAQGKPGFTKDGQLSGLEGDQSYTYGWEDGNPFENLPLHLANLLAPTLQTVGAYESGRRVCIQIEGVGGIARQFTTNQVFTYPGPGRTGVVTSQTVHNEEPASPGDVVGLPQGRTTGPTIYVFAAGPWLLTGTMSISDAKVTGPHGAVAIRVVDPAQHPKIKYYVSNGVFFLIPVTPLAAHTTYTATVTLHAADGTVQTHAWHFSTS